MTSWKFPWLGLLLALLVAWIIALYGLWSYATVTKDEWMFAWTSLLITWGHLSNLNFKGKRADRA